jgi:glutaminase
MTDILTESGLDPTNNAVKAALSAATQKDGNICVDLGDKNNLLTKVGLLPGTASKLECASSVLLF